MLKERWDYCARRPYQPEPNTRQGIGHLAYGKMTFVTCLWVIGHLALLARVVLLYAGDNNKVVIG